MNSPESYSADANLQNVVVLESAARTATGTGDSTDALAGFKSVVFQLDVTAAATEAGDTLDVFVQTTVDGENWVDVVAFTQVVGNGGAKRHYAKITRDAALTMFENGSALSAGNVRNILGGHYRVRWAITDVATEENQSFTFSVTANGQ